MVQRLRDLYRSFLPLMKQLKLKIEIQKSGILIGWAKWLFIWVSLFPSVIISLRLKSTVVAFNVLNIDIFRCLVSNDIDITDYTRQLLSEVYVDWIEYK